MQEIDFNERTSLSPATFKAFQKNVKDAFHNYKVGELIINTDVIKSGYIDSVTLSKDETDTVQLSFIWNSSFALTPNQDYTIVYLPQEFRPANGYIYGGCRAEQPYGPASFVACNDDGRVVITASQASKKIAMSCSYKASGGIEV